MVSEHAAGARQVAIVGAGAMGTLFGARLAQAGHRVHMIDVVPALLAAIASGGLELDADDGAHRASVQAGPANQFEFEAHLLIVFTKSMHTRSAITSARHLIGPRTCVLTVQNGLGNVEEIAREVPRRQIVHGMTNLPVDLRGPGRAASHGAGEIRIDAVDGMREQADRLATLLSDAKLPCRVDAEVEVVIWEKVAFNAALNAIAALTRRTVGTLGRHGEAVALARAVVAEVVVVAHARGLAVNAERIGAALEHAFAHHLDHRPSMLQDVLAGRPTEVDYINGAVVGHAARLGLTAPVNQTLHRLVTLLLPEQN